MIDRHPVDWPALIEQLRMQPAELAARIGVTDRMVRFWASGSHSPTHFNGELLIAVYCETLEVGRAAVPVVRGAPERHFRPGSETLPKFDKVKT